MAHRLPARDPRCDWPVAGAVAPAAPLPSRRPRPKRPTDSTSHHGRGSWDASQNTTLASVVKRAGLGRRVVLGPQPGGGRSMLDRRALRAPPTPRVAGASAWRRTLRGQGELPGSCYDPASPVGSHVSAPHAWKQWGSSELNSPSLSTSRPNTQLIRMNSSERTTLRSQKLS